MNSCNKCGETFEITDIGISHHVDAEGNIDHDADADHVAYGTTSKMVSFDFIMDTFVAVEALEGTDPDTLIEQAKDLFRERLADGEAIVIFDSVFDED